MNLMIIQGRLGKDAELKYTGKQTPVLTCSVAVKESFLKNDKWESITEWFECTWWGKTAEKKADYLKKGMEVLVRGKQRTNSWTKI